MTAPDIINRLEAIKKRGGKIVLLDPRRTETARVASEHHFIKPSSDVYFLLAVINVLFAENLVDLDRLEEFTDGIEILREVSEEFSPEHAAELTGISADEIRRIAVEFGSGENGGLLRQNRRFNAEIRRFMSLVDKFDKHSDGKF